MQNWTSQSIQREKTKQTKPIRLPWVRFYPTTPVVRLYPLWRTTGFGQNLSAPAALLGALNELTLTNTNPVEFFTSIRQDHYLNTTKYLLKQTISCDLT